MKKILENISGKRAWDWVSKISQYHRIQGSFSYQEISAIIMDELISIGIPVSAHRYPADGHTKYWDWEMPYSWDIKSGELRITEPISKVIANYKELPMSIVTHSRSCDFEAELIDIGTGSSPEDYKNAKGKIVLMSGSTRGKMPKWLKESGALACIIYPDANRAGPYLDMVRYDGFWPSSDTFDDIQSGFSISLDHALLLKKLLSQGKVKLHAKINAELYSGELETISAVIKGSEFPDEEILFMAHLCHPSAGANDNASGSAGLIEIATTLQYMIENNIIKRPKRSIRFLWMPEFNGTVPYAYENEKQWRNTLAVMNLDMIGEHPITVGYPFEVFKAPYSTPSPLNDILAHYTKKIADHPSGIAVNGTKMPMRYRISNFTGGSDHLISVDSYFGIPSVMLGHNDDFHHSSLDTINKVDPTELQRVMAIALSTAIELANLSSETIKQIWPIIYEGIYSRLGKVSKLVLKAKENINADEYFLNMLYKQAINYEIKLLEYLEKYNCEYAEINTTKDELLKWLDNKINQTEQINTKKYKRNFNGVMSLNKIFALASESDFKKFMAIGDGYGGIIFELMNLVGKQYNVYEIASLLSLNLDKIVLPQDIMPVLELLVKINLIIDLDS